MAKQKRLTLGSQAQFGGVCSGLAEYFDVDVTPIRVGMAIAVLYMGWGLGLYFIMWLAMPEYE